MSIKQLINRLNPLCRQAMEQGAHLCVASGHFSIDVPHVLVHIVRNKESDFWALCRHYNVDQDVLIGALEALLKTYKTGNSTTPSFSPHVLTLLEKSWLFTSVDVGGERVRSGTFLHSLLDSQGLLGWVTENIPDLLHIPRAEFFKECVQLLRTLPESQYEQKVPKEGQTELSPASCEYLNKYTVDLTQQARLGRLAPVWGRDAQVYQVINILARSRQNNPILVGEAGVGKTAIVEGLALMIADRKVPDFLQNTAIHSLDMGLLEAGAGVQGEFESRLKNLIDDIQSAVHPIILFVDEAHMLLAGDKGKHDAANILKPLLARGELQTIAATTWDEYKQYFEKDAAMVRRFQLVHVKEPDNDDAVSMLRALVPFLQEKHQCSITNEALYAAVALSRRYIGDRRLPDKAVSVLDTACARVLVSQKVTPLALVQVQRQYDMLQKEKSQLTHDQKMGYDVTVRLQEVQQEEKDVQQAIKELEVQWHEERDCVKEMVDLAQSRGETAEALQGCMSTLEGIRARREGMVFPWVCADNVAQVVATWTGIPVGKMLRDESEAFLRIAPTLSERIIGQKAGIDLIANTMMTHKAQLDDPDKPLGVFLLAGPSGVGKTETAHVLSEYFFGGAQNMVVINLSEYQEAHTVSLLRGSPPGYVGYGKGGVLTEMVRRQPYSVVLLDEVEKAHPDVIELFYQVFDKGMLEDGTGVRVDFKNTLILMTSNLATQTIADCVQKKMTAADIRTAIMPELTAHFKPAFLARVSVIPYTQLSASEIAEIVALKWRKIADRVMSNHGVEVVLDKAAQRLLESLGQDEDSGARSIDACIQHRILPIIAHYILQKQSTDDPLGKDMTITAFNDQFLIK